LLDVGDHLGDLGRRGRLREGDVGEQLAGAFDHDVDVALPVRVAEVVDAHARVPEAVLGRGEHAHDHLGVLALAPGRGAVLAVAGDVEDRAELVLDLERLGDEVLVPREVLARRDGGKRPLPREQGRVGVERLGHRPRLYPRSALMPSRSSCSSLSVASMRLRAKSLMSRPLTISYLPPLQVTGNPYMTPSGMP